MEAERWPEPLEQRVVERLVEPGFVFATAGRGEWWPLKALQFRLLAAASVKRQLLSSLSKLSKLKIALVSVYEATGRFLQRDEAIDVLCNGAGCMCSASYPSPKYIYLKIFTHLFWGCGDLSYIVMMLQSGGLRWLFRKDGLMVASMFFSARVAK